MTASTRGVCQLKSELPQNGEKNIVPKSPAIVSVVRTCLEDELLLCCSRTCIGAETTEQIRTLLQNEIDWAYLIQTAFKHGTVPLLYQSLNVTCPEALPKAVLDELRRHFHANALRNHFLTGELLKLLTQFEVHGIPVLPFKGPALAASAYGNLALRQFCDLDILVHEQDVLRAKDLLISQGYQPLYHLTGAEEAAYILSHGQYPFGRDYGKISVELHWRILEPPFPFPLDIECLWERLEPISLAGKTVLTFSPGDLLLILCAHGTKSRWARLEWICCVAEHVRVHQEMDWGWVMQQASASRSERMLFLGLFLASDLLGTTLPNEILQRIQANVVVKSLSVRVQERLFREREADGRLGRFKTNAFVLEYIKRFFFLFRASESRAGHIARHFPYFLLRVATTPTSKGRTLLPLRVLFSFLDYLIRLTQLDRDR